MTDTGIGAAVRRKEDHRFLTGKGRYVDDMNRPHQVYAHILRSPMAHARIAGINTADALAVPGVVAVLTGQDMAADGVGGLPCGWGITSKDGTPMAEPAHLPLAAGYGSPCGRTGSRGFSADTEYRQRCRRIGRRRL